MKTTRTCLEINDLNSSVLTTCLVRAFTPKLNPILDLSMNGPTGLPVPEPVALESSGVSECAKAAVVQKVKCSNVALLFAKLLLRLLQNPSRRSLSFFSGPTGQRAIKHAAQVSECELESAARRGDARESVKKRNLAGPACAIRGEDGQSGASARSDAARERKPERARASEATRAQAPNRKVKFATGLVRLRLRYRRQRRSR